MAARVLSTFWHPDKSQHTVEGMFFESRRRAYEHWAIYNFTVACETSVLKGENLLLDSLLRPFSLVKTILLHLGG